MAQQRVQKSKAKAKKGGGDDDTGKIREAIRRAKAAAEAARKKSS